MASCYVQTRVSQRIYFCLCKRDMGCGETEWCNDYTVRLTSDDFRVSRQNCTMSNLSLTDIYKYLFHIYSPYIDNDSIYSVFFFFFTFSLYYCET